MTEVPLYNSKDLQHKFLDWKWPPPPLPNFSENSSVLERGSFPNEFFWAFFIYYKRFFQSNLVLFWFWMFCFILIQYHRWHRALAPISDADSRLALLSTCAACWVTIYVPELLFAVFLALFGFTEYICVSFVWYVLVNTVYITWYPKLQSCTPKHTSNTTKTPRIWFLRGFINI